MKADSDQSERIAELEAAAIATAIDDPYGRLKRMTGALTAIGGWAENHGHDHIAAIAADALGGAEWKRHG